MNTDALKTASEALNPSSIRLTVTVAPSEVEVAIRRAYADMAAAVKVPGFRKGKVPRPVLDRHVGREHVLGEAREELLNQVYPAALRVERIRAIGRPDLDGVEALVEGQEFTFVATVPVKPLLSLSSRDGISVAVPPAEATEREVDAQIQYIRERFATLEPVLDRGVEKGDFALISFVATVGGEAYDGNIVDKYLYEMGRGLMPSEFEAGLVGARAGEHVEIEFAVPEGSSNPEFVGKTARFEVEVHEVKAKVLPALDDVFAESAAAYESMDEMRTDVKERLDAAKASGRKRMLEKRASAALAERLIGEVPHQMVEAKRDSILAEFTASLEQRGMALDSYAEAMGIERDRILSDIGGQAEALAREELALDALFHELGLTVADEEIDEECTRLAQAGEVDVEELKRRWADTQAFDILKEEIARRKALAWLVDPANVEIIESDEDPPAGARDSGLE